MFLEGSLLIDGGYINNLPVDLMRELYKPNTVGDGGDGDEPQMSCEND